MEHRRTVETFGERLPLVGREHEGGLIGNDLLGSCAGAFEDKVGHVHTADLGPGANEVFLKSAGAQVDAAAPGLLGGCPLKCSC